ncbi:MAG: HDOD domain-containing protein [Planctomyces sp.]|nr:HDOD domain-containing protein [Planctomyces sp.]
MSIDLTKFTRLPTLPTVAVRLLQRFADPDVNLASITEILRPDPALTASVLRAAGSVEFGVGRPLSDLGRAIGMLGARRVTSLVLCFTLSEDSMKPGPLAALYRDVWLRSVILAITAELLARRRARALEAEHFTAGLLADIGRLAMLKSHPDEYCIVADQIRHDPQRADDLERAAFGLTHSDLAVALFRNWRLPAEFSEAVRLRNASLADLQSQPSGESRPLVHGIAVATAVGSMFCDACKGAAFDRVSDLARTLYGMTADESDDFLGAVRERVGACAGILRANTSLLGSAEEVMAEARRQLERQIGDSSDAMAVPDLAESAG